MLLNRLRVFSEFSKLLCFDTSFYFYCKIIKASCRFKVILKVFNNNRKIRNLELQLVNIVLCLRFQKMSAQSLFPLLTFYGIVQL